MTTPFPTFVDVPDPANPPSGAQRVTATYLNSVNGAVNSLEAAQDQTEAAVAALGSDLDAVETAVAGKVSSTGGSVTGPTSVIDETATGTAFVVRARAKQASTFLLVPSDWTPGGGGPALGRYAMSVICLEKTGEVGALNVASEGADASAINASGKELNRGTIKVSHHGGDGTDVAGSALSIDLQTDSGKTTTASRGIFITSTTGGTLGDPILVRHNSRDDFVVKATGRVGIGLAVAATPGGVLEVRANDDTTPTISVRANSTAAQNLLEFKRASDGAVRTRVSATCQLVTQEVAYFAGPAIQVGSTSTQVGGGSGVVGIANASTVPNSNPTGGGVLYAEGGALKWRGSSGTVTTLGPA